MTSKIIKIFDTTLRDGEQAPGFSMNAVEKVTVAKKLEQLQVDVIEAGFPASSPGDFESVKTISGIITDCIVAGLCRSLKKDIDIAWGALSTAQSPRLHIFLATSPIHMEYKLRMSPDQVVEQATESVRYAKQFCSDIEFSAEDASRSDRDFLCRIFNAAILAGATTVNIADTVGYAMPEEFAQLVLYVKERLHTNAELSVHVHNDLGLAVASSLAAVQAGIDQIECTINGIGERAGNAALEEIVMALRLRKDFHAADTRIDTTQLYSASRLVTQVTGMKVQPNKAIIGDNAFAHEAGIHQHGIMANSATYEIMSPESVGFAKNRIVLGKHSGRHAFEDRLHTLGFNLDAASLEAAFNNFKALAEKKKEVSDRDIEALVSELRNVVSETWKLEHWEVNTGSALGATGTIRLQNRDGIFFKDAAMGDGPIDALYNAINSIIKKNIELELYEIGAITGGSASQGETMVKINYLGRRWNGRGVSTDIIESSIKAYMSAVNAMEWDLGSAAESANSAVALSLEDAT